MSILTTTLVHSEEGSEASLQLLVQIRDPAVVSRHPDGSISIDNRASRLMEAVLAEANISYEIQLYPWIRMLQEIKSRKNVLIYPMPRTADRGKDVYWIGTIRPATTNLYGLRERMSELPTTLSDARERSIGVIRGSGTEQYLEGQGFTQLRRFADIKNPIIMLERNRFDLFPFQPRGVQKLLQRQNLPSDYLVPMISLQDLTTEWYFAVSNQTDEHIKNALTDAYQRVVADGRYARIMGIEYSTSFSD